VVLVVTDFVAQLGNFLLDVFGHGLPLSPKRSLQICFGNYTVSASVRGTAILAGKDHGQTARATAPWHLFPTLLDTAATRLLVSAGRKQERRGVRVMNLRHILIATTVAAAFVARLAAAPQSDKQPVTSNTGRFGDASGTAIKYQDYLYGVVKEKKPNELILTKTKFGVDQTFKLTRKTKFTLDGKAGSYDKLKVGDAIYIDTDTDKKTGVLTAKKVVGGVDIPSLPSAE
jgi:hypothetical protein